MNGATLIKGIWMKLYLILIFIISLLFGSDDRIIDIIVKNCSKNNNKICYQSIRDYIDNDDVKIDWNLVKKLSINLCNNSYGDACQLLGNMYAPNSIKSIKKNWKISAKYHKKACELGNMVSCNNLGVLYKLGIFYKKNYKKALILFTKACEDKDHPAVDKACSNKDNVLSLLQQEN